MTLQEISALLDDLDLAHTVGDDHVRLEVATQRYRRPTGEAVAPLTILVQEDGRFFVLFAAGAFSAAGPHAGCAYRACNYLNAKMRLVRFEFDFQNGDVNTLVELPVEDGTLTPAQLRRCIAQLVGALEATYPIIHRAAAEGVLILHGRRVETEDMLTDVLAETPPDVLASALHRADRRQRG